MTSDKLYILFLISIIFLFFSIITIEILEYNKVDKYVIPKDYKIVPFKDEFIIMNSDQSKFLVWYDDNIYFFEDYSGNLIGSEHYLKTHIIKYKNNLKLIEDKKIIDSKLKLK